VFTPTPYPALSPSVVDATTSTSNNLITNALRPDALPPPVPLPSPAAEPGAQNLPRPVPLPSPSAVPGAQNLPEPVPLPGAPDRRQTLPEAPGGVFTPTQYSEQANPYLGQPMAPQTMPWLGQNPGMQLLSSLGSRFGTTTSPIGLPATVGGSGYFDLDQVAQGMLGDGSDPAWAEAVRQAHAAMRGSGGDPARVGGLSWGPGGMV
jgi:hypothetical protein